MRKLTYKFIAICLVIFLLPAAVYAQAITYTVEQHSPDAGFQRMEYKSYPGPVEGLLSTSESWTGFFRQDGRDIQIDLGETKRISDISMEFQQNKAAGITLPRFMGASVSVDGEKWNYLGRAGHLVPAGDMTEQTRTLKLSFPALEARYITLSFPVDVWVFARNLVITEEGGKSASEQPAILAPAKEFEHEQGSYLQIPGVNDILLIYSGAHGDLGTWKREDFLPLVTYVDENGNTQDSLFDTFLFLPFPEVESTKEGWQAYLKGLFQEGEQLDALNELSKSIQQNYPELQVRPKVILTLPYPSPKQEEFTKNISFSADHVGQKQAIENRQAAVADYFHTLMSMWDNAKFEALDLAGIYWYQETMDVTVPDEARLVRFVNDLVHSKGEKTYWIPYFGSKGYENWQEYGFDYVILQPNFYAKEDPPEERMTNLAELARKYHLAVELEIDDKALYNRFYHDLFYTQLDIAHKLGLDKEATNAYYMGTKSVLNAAKSDLAPVRQVYDDIYLWIKGKYQPKNS